MLRVECELQYLPTQDAQGEKPKQGSLAGLQVRPLKNESSKRYIKLPASMVALLETLYSQQQAHKAKAGDLWQDEAPAHLRRDWIFSNELGSPRHPDSFPKRFKKFLARAGFAPEEVKLPRRAGQGSHVGGGYEYGTHAAEQHRRVQPAVLPRTAPLSGYILRRTRPRAKYK